MQNTYMILLLSSLLLACGGTPVDTPVPDAGYGPDARPIPVEIEVVFDSLQTAEIEGRLFLDLDGDDLVDRNVAIEPQTVQGGGSVLLRTLLLEQGTALDMARCGYSLSFALETGFTDSEYGWMDFDRSKILEQLGTITCHEAPRFGF